MKTLEEFCCLNEACPDFGKRGGGQPLRARFDFAFQVIV